MSDIVVKVRGKEYIVKTDRRYTETDEWAKLEGKIVVCGVTDYAQKRIKKTLLQLNYHKLVE